MKRFLILGVMLCLLSPTYLYAGWETAGKILTGVVIGHVVSEATRTPTPSRRIRHRPAYREVRVWVPGRYQTYYKHRVTPGRYDKIRVYRDDGSYYYIREWIPPTASPVRVREWIPGHWETRIERIPSRW